MICKECKGETGFTLVRYANTEENVLKTLEGVPAHQEHIHTDAGVFCGDGCLITYLTRKMRP